MNLKKVAKILGIEVEKDLPITGFSVDTRLTKPGDLFIALKGAKFDGHDFLDEAFAKGAVAAIVSRGELGLKVPDPLKALQRLANAVIEEKNPRIVAITGSVGKTTTKDFTATLLKEKYAVTVFPGNPNSQIGLPLAILNHPIEEVLVLEMGMDLPGQIAELVAIAPPEVALITTTALVHAKNFDSLEAIGRSKAEIFSHPKTKWGILSPDIVNSKELTQIGTCQKQFFLPVAMTLKIPGKHNQHNFSAAVSIARYFGLTEEEIQEGARKLKLPEKRLEILQLKGATFLNDSYNACEVSMKAALQSLPAPKNGGKRIACLGEMMELGPFSEKCHSEVGKKSLETIDLMLCLGEGCWPIVKIWNDAGRAVHFFNERNDLVQKLREVLHEGDSVLLKGSNSKQMWKVIEEI